MLTSQVMPSATASPQKKWTDGFDEFKDPRSRAKIDRGNQISTQIFVDSHVSQG
jgi:hypothetical protein